jgi:histidine triad (HIT) family protein
VARAVRDAVQPQGMNIWQSNGEAAGQEVFHLHVHVLPRAAGDGMLRVYPRRPDYPPRAQLDELAAEIAKRISV